MAPPISAPKRRRWLLALILLLLLGLLAALGVLGYQELQSSELQAEYLAPYAAQMRFRVKEGPSDSIRFPRHGPADQRAGYAQLPRLLPQLAADGFAVASQARISPQMADFADRGFYLPYREKTPVGLAIHGCAGEPLYQARFPGRTWDGFEAIPEIVVRALLFVENRGLLDPRYPHRNPALDWGRLARASTELALEAIDGSHDAPGASTLATQIEKYRHSPEGLTADVREKARQMVSATLRAYLDGERTLPARQRIVLEYLNTVPLAAAPGFGEVNGMGDGLWAWYGADFDRVNRALRGEAGVEAQGLALRQALSLIIAQRRPSYYLERDRAGLASLTDSHLRLLAREGVIGRALRDAALAARPAFRQGPVAAAGSSFVERKAANAIRARLSSQLELGSLYALDRLDLTVSSTLHGPTQDAVTAVLRQLRDPAYLHKAGMAGYRMLEHGDPAGVIYSFTLWERGEHANRVRVQADTWDQPFDINEGAKLDLGSSAKLRTLVTYLEVIASLHARYARMPREELEQVELPKEATLARWAVDWLLQAEQPDLTAMLEAAMDRRYSADPDEEFFTGGGVLRFENFKHEDDRQVPTVWEALQESINLAFVRVMRDVVQHYMYEIAGSTASLLRDAGDPQRRAILERFADREGRQFIQRFWHDYSGLKPQEALQRLADSARQKPKRLAALFRAVKPEAGPEALAAFLKAQLEDYDPSPEMVASLYERNSPQRYGLADLGYLAGVHPLELWLVGYLQQHPGARLQDALAASGRERQEVYAWLFRTRHKNTQDVRIRSLLEVEAFLEIERAWKRLGYPFDSLVPSYATALGSSADRPAALAQLVGILLNDGVKLPTLRVDELHFAAGTPYETRLTRAADPAQRVLPAEVAQVARKAMMRVVEAGTARRLAGTYRLPDDSPMAVGGKTGTGDHRYETFGPHGDVVSSRVVNRAATFVFFLGERFFGVVTAYVPGPEAARYGFTSSLPVQLLKYLAPTLAPLVAAEPGSPCGDEPPLPAVTAAIAAP